MSETRGTAPTPDGDKPGDRAVPVDRVQRRTIAVLAASQVLGGIGVATGVAVASLIASELSGSDAIAGLAQTSAVVGAAVVALPLSRLAARGGRRGSLTSGYVVALAGALVAAAATWWGAWPLLLAGMLLFGAGSATGLASRFTATDLARPERRATDLSIVVWATTVGSVLGPNLAGVTEQLGLLEGAPGDHAGHAGDATSPVPFLVAALAFAGAAAAVWLLLRPDPLRVAADRAAAAAGGRADADVDVTALPGVAATTTSRPGFREGLAAGWSVLRASPTAQLALGAIVVSHLVMVGLMSMTPVHMNHGGASLQVVGVVISAHIAGMYVLSPVIGWLADRWGHARVLGAGGVVLLVSAVTVAGAPSDDAARLTVGLVLLGVGWSCGLVAGSALLIDGTPPAHRTAVQGLSDFSMNLGGALGGVLAGVVIAVASYAVLAWCAAVLLGAYLMVLVWKMPRRRVA
ncbi:MFS transporter [Oerskovia flava]|uniref:MFS transporter n=1 Tax=Oerskovia flava TaxID=2986422 RepID=UPI0022400B74|nr:MFS transporter [Oerskovia sp. JB1-3-2]